MALRFSEKNQIYLIGSQNHGFLVFWFFGSVVPKNHRTSAQMVFCTKNQKTKKPTNHPLPTLAVLNFYNFLQVPRKKLMHNIMQYSGGATTTTTD